MLQEMRQRAPHRNMLMREQVEDLQRALSNSPDPVVSAFARTIVGADHNRFATAFAGLNDGDLTKVYDWILSAREMNRSFRDVTPERDQSPQSAAALRFLEIYYSGNFVPRN